MNPHRNKEASNPIKSSKNTLDAADNSMEEHKRLIQQSRSLIAETAQLLNSIRARRAQPTAKHTSTDTSQA